MLNYQRKCERLVAMLQTIRLYCAHLSVSFLKSNSKNENFNCVHLIASEDVILKHWR